MKCLSPMPSNESRPAEAATRRSFLHGGLRLLAGCACVEGLLALPAFAGDGRDKRDRERDGERPEGPQLPHVVEREYAMKANYLTSLPRFVEWPAGMVPRPDSPIVIGVLAKPEFFGFLHRYVRDRRIDGRPLFLKPVRKPADARDCHILYVNSWISERSPRMLSLIVKDQPILTVGESPNFLQQGGILNFALGDRKITLEVNCEAAKRASLAISPKLLAICKRVAKDEEK